MIYIVHSISCNLWNKGNYCYYDSVVFLCFVDQIQIQVPEVYRKAASRVVDAFLHAYRKGDRSRAVRAFNKWHDDYKTYDKIMTDTYKYVVSENQAGSAEGKMVLQMPENILYRKIMKRVCL